MDVSCPHCAGLITSHDPSMAGQMVQCPHCGGVLQMPGVSVATPAPTYRRKRKRGPSPAAIAGLVVVLAACFIGSWWLVGYVTGTGLPFGAPRMDCSSREAMKSSVERMTKGMSEAEKEELHKAVVVVLFTGALQRVFSWDFEDGDELRLAKEKLHGKTAEQIIADANEIRRNMK